MKNDLHEFLAQVRQEEGLQQELKSVESKEELITRVAHLASEKGYSVSEADVQNEINRHTEGGEMDQKELDQIAGGVPWWDWALGLGSVEC